MSEHEGGVCSVYAAAKRIGRHPRTVRRWIDDGILAAERDSSGGWAVSIESLDAVAAESRDGDDPAQSADLARDLSGLAKGLSDAVRAMTASSVRREELYLDHLEALLSKTVAFAEASQVRIQNLVAGWERAQSEAAERQLLVQSTMAAEVRKDAVVEWAMSTIPRMVSASRGSRKLLDLARTLTPEQIEAMSILLSEEQITAIREVVDFAKTMPVEGEQKGP
jgi:hypothetical protein